jgi:hypothetical protein
MQKLLSPAQSLAVSSYRIITQMGETQIFLLCLTGVGYDNSASKL